MKSRNLLFHAFLQDFCVTDGVKIFSVNDGGNTNFHNATVVQVAVIKWDSVEVGSTLDSIIIVCISNGVC